MVTPEYLIVYLVQDEHESWYDYYQVLERLGTDKEQAFNKFKENKYAKRFPDSFVLFVLQNQTNAFNVNLNPKDVIDNLKGGVSKEMKLYIRDKFIEVERDIRQAFIKENKTNWYWLETHKLINGDVTLHEYSSNPRGNLFEHEIRWERK